jgi:hypothetical protein
MDYVCSIDIGKKNFALTIEQVDTTLLSKIVDLPDKDKYNSDGTLKQEFQKIINQVYLSGKIIYSKNNDLTKNTEKSTYLDREIYFNMIDLLDSLSQEYLNKCSHFIIEQQMSFGKKHNTMALKLGQHCQSYFIFNYGRFKNTIEFPAYHKTKILGAQKIQITTKKGIIKYKPIDKPARKKWSIVEAKKVLELRGDDKTLSYLTSSKKGDDIADTLIQLQAWKYLHYVAKKDI